MKNMSNDKDFKPLADLLHEAGSRPAPDQEITAAVYQAVAAEWERTTVKSKQYWPLLAAVASLVAIAILVIQLAAPDIPVSRFQVARLDGTAEQWIDGQWQALVAGSAVSESARIRTGPNAALALDGPRGVGLRFDASSEFSIAAQSLQLVNGAVFLDLNPLARGQYQVTTSLGVVRHLGTRFVVRFQDEALSVMVRDGRVSLDSGEQSVKLIAGQAVRADLEGVGTITEMPLDDDAWQWVADASPGMNLDGRTVAEFLDWVATETGMQLIYADSALERAAGKATLSGSVNDMSARMALDPVLSATHFSASIKDGQISITRGL